MGLLPWRGRLTSEDCSIPPIDQRDRRPLAVQLRDDLRGSIAADDLRPGRQLPTEAELVARYGVARTTVREALRLLEQDGLVHTRHGVGRFVAAPTVERPITRLESVTRMMEAQGYVVRNRVLAVGEIEPDDAERSTLELGADARAIRLERVRLQGRDPLIYSIDVIPLDLLPGPLEERDWSGSLVTLLETNGALMASATASMRAATLPPDVVGRVGADPALPWLLLEQTCYADDGRPIIRSRDYHRGDAFAFHVLRRAEPRPEWSAT